MWKFWKLYCLTGVYKIVIMVVLTFFLKLAQMPLNSRGKEKEVEHFGGYVGEISLWNCNSLCSVLVDILKWMCG